MSATDFAAEKPFWAMLAEVSAGEGSERTLENFRNRGIYAHFPEPLNPLTWPISLCPFPWAFKPISLAHLPTPISLGL